MAINNSINSQQYLDLTSSPTFDNINLTENINFPANNANEFGSSPNRASNIWTNLINGIQPSGGVFMQTTNGSIVTATTAETNILGTGVGTLMVPANTFTISGFSMVLAGNFSSLNGDTLTIRLKTNGVTSLGVLLIELENATAQYFEIEADFSITALGGPGVAKITTNFDFTYNRNVGNEFVGQRTVDFNGTAVDTTIANTLTVTAEFSSASASNSIQCRLANLTRTF